MTYECPYCHEDLLYWDYYGRICAHQDGKVIGEIYSCANEKCKSYQQCFYNESGYGDFELKEGFPC